MIWNTCDKCCLLLLPSGLFTENFEQLNGAVYFVVVYFAGLPSENLGQMIWYSLFVVALSFTFTFNI